MLGHHMNLVAFRLLRKKWATCENFNFGQMVQRPPVENSPSAYGLTNSNLNKNRLTMF